MKRDSHDEDCSQFCIYLVPSLLNNHRLQNVANKDLAAQAIEIDLLTATEKGQDQLDAFVEERLLPIEERRVIFKDKFSKEILDVWLSVRIAAVRHNRVGENRECTNSLLYVPLSPTEVNGELRIGSSAILADMLTTDVPCPNHLDATDLQDEPILVIDGRALVFVIGKHKQLRHLGN